MTLGKTQKPQDKWMKYLNERRQRWKSQTFEFEKNTARAELQIFFKYDDNFTSKDSQTLSHRGRSDSETETVRQKRQRDRDAHVKSINIKANLRCKPLRFIELNIVPVFVNPGDGRDGGDDGDDGDARQTLVANSGRSFIKVSQKGSRV
ncbi:hypothetical protein JOB18_009447 [Solea senegalensis]|uniref:Uncharacterized protein n=1 Tax=Solea senegalensis TaxID=28829 RepID=A0AAV6Q112_SOLSE|nr:hypothetical protein JOB18_009447 [Solea senegalensis]